MDKKGLNKAIIAGIKQTIDAHGPISKDRIGSAAKRIAGAVFRYIKQEQHKHEANDSSSGQ